MKNQIGFFLSKIFSPGTMRNFFGSILLILLKILFDQQIQCIFGFIIWLINILLYFFLVNAKLYDNSISTVKKKLKFKTFFKDILNQSEFF